MPLRQVSESIISILLMKKLRLWEVKWLAYGRKSGKCWEAEVEQVAEKQFITRFLYTKIQNAFYYTIFNSKSDT